MDETNSDQNIGCQSMHLEEMSEHQSVIGIVIHFFRRLKRFLRRRSKVLLKQIANIGKLIFPSINREINFRSQVFTVGQTVRIKSREEILATLDHRNRLKGCGFMEEMWQYCGTKQRILKPVQRFLDERDFQIKQAHHIFILDGVNCQGTNDFGRCDRNCYYFWREEWLEKIE